MNINQLNEHVARSIGLLTSIADPTPERYRNYQIPNRENIEIGDIVKYKWLTGTVIHKTKLKYHISFNSFERGNNISKIGVNNKVQKVTHALPSNEMLNKGRLNKYIQQGGLIKYKYVNRTLSRHDYYFLPDYENITFDIGLDAKKVSPYDNLNAYISPSGAIRGFTIPTESELNGVIQAFEEEIVAREAEIKAAKKEAARLRREEAKKAPLRAATRSKIEKIVKSIYPNALFGNYLDFNFNSYSNPKAEYSAVIHFESLNVTNRRGLSRTILDMNVRFDFDKDGIMCNEMLGARSTLTNLEYAHGYHFSHLKRTTRGDQWSKFCLGSTDLSMMISQLMSEHKPLLFESIMYMLPNYLSHESLDGGPYYKMSNLISRSSGENSSNIISESSIRRMLIPQLTKIPLKLTKCNHHETLIVDGNDGSFEDAVSRILIDNLPNSEINKHCVYKDIINKVYHPIPESTNNSDSISVGRANSELSDRPPLMVINGKEYKIKVISESVNQEEVDNFKTDPSFIKVMLRESYDKICEIINNYLYGYAQLKSISTEYGKIQQEKEQTTQTKQTTEYEQTQE